MSRTESNRTKELVRDFAERTLDGRALDDTLAKVRELSRVKAREGFPQDFAETLAVMAAERCLARQTDGAACQRVMARLADGLLSLPAQDFGVGLRRFCSMVAIDPRRAPREVAPGRSGSEFTTRFDRRLGAAGAEPSADYALLVREGLPGTSVMVTLSAEAQADMVRCFASHPRYDASKHDVTLRKAVSGAFRFAPKHVRANPAIRAIERPPRTAARRGP